MRDFRLNNDPHVDTGETVHAWGAWEGLVDYHAASMTFFMATGLCFQAWLCVRLRL